MFVGDFTNIIVKTYGVHKNYECAIFHLNSL